MLHAPVHKLGVIEFGCYYCPKCLLASSKAPTLKQRQVLTMDNLQAHKGHRGYAG